MSEVEVNEHIDNEIPEQAPAEELVDLILTGELHAANQKFNSIVEGKVIDAIEEEKHKISQTLFADDEEEVDEGKIPPQFLKGKDKDEEEDEDDSPVGKKGKDDDSDDDDDDDDDDDSDDDDGDKPKKGKIPPQFMKKEEIGEMIGDREDDAFQRRNIEADKARHKEAQSKGYANDIDRRRGKKSTVQRVKNAVGSLVNKATGNKNEGVTGDPDANEKALAKNRAMAKKYGQVRQGIPPEKKTEAVEPVDEISSATADRASQKAYNDIRDNPSSQKPTLGTTKTAQSDAKRKRQTDKFDAYRDKKDFDKKGSKKGGAAKAAGKMGQKSDQQRHTDWRDNPDDQNQGHYVSNSFDPGEASSNVELPEDSFVAQVAAHLSGQRKGVVTELSTDLLKRAASTAHKDMEKQKDYHDLAAHDGGSTEREKWTKKRAEKREKQATKFSAAAGEKPPKPESQDSRDKRLRKTKRDMFS